ncbi:MAG: NifU family protein [Actinobacteria bacterium]|nr:NifU family protein [Actinomycetota bacterium]
MATQPVQAAQHSEEPGNEPVVRVTDAARSMVLQARADEADASKLALWIEVAGINGDAYSYDVFFQAVAHAGRGDVVQHHDDLPVVIPGASLAMLRGATLDVSGEGEDGGLVILNPNTPPAATGSRSLAAELPPGATEDLSGDLARQVVAILEEQINPSIAMHGGHAELVAIDEGQGAAFLRLGGGCQGCGLAQVTLSQGIEVAIKEAIPEIISVVDVTDHASGSDPYFQAAKK